MMLKPYKGFQGAVTFVDPEANSLTAEAINTPAGIHAEAGTPAELQREFEKSVDVYLEWCAENGEEPLKPFAGQIPLRVGPELHKRAHVAARLAGQSLNGWIKDLVERETAVAPTVMRDAGISWDVPAASPVKASGKATLATAARSRLKARQAHA